MNKEISISEELLEKYAGKYNAPQTGIVTILKNGSDLEMQAGKMHQKIKAESQTLFFMDQTGLSFEFVEGKKRGNRKVNCKGERTNCRRSRAHRLVSDSHKKGTKVTV